MTSKSTYTTTDQKQQYVYYVYAYIRSKISNCGKFPIGSPYYIGKGKGDRIHQSHKVGVPNNDDFIILLETNLSNCGALALERRYIRWYGRIDIGTGCLRNLTDGGEGTIGYKITNSHKESIIKSNQTRLITQQHRDNQRAALGKFYKNREKFVIDEMVFQDLLNTYAEISTPSPEINFDQKVKKEGRPQSAESRLKISIGLTGRECSDETKNKIGDANTDKTIYVFYNIKTNIKEVMNRHDFLKKYEGSISGISVCRLINQRVKKAKDWIIFRPPA